MSTSGSKAHGVFPLPLAVDLGIQALRGLEAIHAAGVIHRDISPDNMMITRDRRGRYQMKLIDLGLAKNLEVQAGLEITQAGIFMGKLMYCSPEQAGAIKDAPLDHRSDLYSFAAVLYEMITGKPPFDSENQHGFVFKRLTEPPQPLIGRNPQVRVPQELNDLVLRGLEKDRELRYPDALSFLQALVHMAEQLRQVATQEIELPAVARSSAKPAPASSPRPTSRSGSASELSREERIDLLAQIERAAKKVSESSRLADLAKQAFAARRYDDAAALVTQLEAVSPRNPAVAQLKAQLAEVGKAFSALPAKPGAAARGVTPAPAPLAERAVAPTPAPLPVPTAPLASIAPITPIPVQPIAAPRAAPVRPVPTEPTTEQREHAAKVAEAERLLVKYLQENKQSLASFALETLVELDPHHPRRDLFARAVGIMGEERGKMEIAGAILAEGRDAVLHGDLVAARRKLDQLEKSDPTLQLSEALRNSIQSAEHQAASDAAVDRRRDNLESLLEARRLEEAERELAGLSATGLAKSRSRTTGYASPISPPWPSASRSRRSSSVSTRRRSRPRTGMRRATSCSISGARFPKPAAHAAVQRDQPTGGSASPPAGNRTGSAAARELSPAEEARRGRAGLQDRPADGSGVPAPGSSPKPGSTISCVDRSRFLPGQRCAP